MRLSFLAVLISLLPLIYSCEDQIKDPQNIEITYTLIDSVSPLRVLLHVNKNLLNADWVLNDSSSVGDGALDSVELILYKPGLNHIDLVAKGIDKVHYKGSVEINAPGYASILEICGFYFRDNIKLPIDEDSVQVKVIHNNGLDVPEYVRVFSTSDFLGHDTIIFKNPIVLNAFDCVDIMDAHPSFAYFIVQGIPMYDHESTFKEYLFSEIEVFSQYYWLRLGLPPHQMQIFGMFSSNIEARLFVNWR